MKKCSSIIICIGNCKLKQQWDTTTYLLEWSRSKTMITSTTPKDVRIRNRVVAGGKAERYSHFGSQFGSFLEKRQSYQWSSNCAPWYLPKWAEQPQQQQRKAIGEWENPALTAVCSGSSLPWEGGQWNLHTHTCQDTVHTSSQQDKELPFLRILLVKQMTESRSVAPHHICEGWGIASSEQKPLVLSSHVPYDWL